MQLPRVPGPDQLSRREPYREKKGPRCVEANVTNNLTAFAAVVMPAVRAAFLARAAADGA